MQPKPHTCGQHEHMIILDDPYTIQGCFESAELQLADYVQRDSLRETFLHPDRPKGYEVMTLTPDADQQAWEMWAKHCDDPPNFQTLSTYKMSSKTHHIRVGDKLIFDMFTKRFTMQVEDIALEDKTNEYLMHYDGTVKGKIFQVSDPKEEFTMEYQQIKPDQPKEDFVTAYRRIKPSHIVNDVFKLDYTMFTQKLLDQIYQNLMLPSPLVNGEKPMSTCTTANCPLNTPPVLGPITPGAYRMRNGEKAIIEYVRTGANIPYPVMGHTIANPGGIRAWALSGRWHKDQHNEWDIVAVWVDPPVITKEGIYLRGDGHEVQIVTHPGSNAEPPHKWLDRTNYKAYDDNGTGRASANTADNRIVKFVRNLAPACEITRPGVYETSTGLKVSITRSGGEWVATYGESQAIVNKDGTFKGGNYLNYISKFVEPLWRDVQYSDYLQLPLPCRVRDDAKDGWSTQTLQALCPNLYNSGNNHLYLTKHSRSPNLYGIWKFCQIEVQ